MTGSLDGHVAYAVVFKTMSRLKFDDNCIKFTLKS